MRQRQYSLKVRGEVVCYDTKRATGMSLVLGYQGALMHGTGTQKATRSFNQFHRYKWRKAIIESLTLILCLIGACNNVLGQQSALFPFGQNSIGRAARTSFLVQESNLSTRIQTVVQRLFGAGVEPATERNPYYLTGDFNGDTREDLLILVRLNSMSNLPHEVRVLNPWGYESENSTKPSTLALAIIHGSSDGWDTLAPMGRFLLVDREYFSTPIWEGSQDSPLSLKRRRLSGSKGRVVLPKMAKGDAVSLGTEAGIDIVLYWDGKTYRIYQPREEP